MTLVFYTKGAREKSRRFRSAAYVDATVVTCALCVIFTILVSFSQENALFASKAEINVFFKNVDFSL